MDRPSFQKAFVNAVAQVANINAGMVVIMNYYDTTKKNGVGLVVEVNVDLSPKGTEVLSNGVVLLAEGMGSMVVGDIPQTHSTTGLRAENVTRICNVNAATGLSASRHEAISRSAFGVSLEGIGYGHDGFVRNNALSDSQLLGLGRTEFTGLGAWQAFSQLSNTGAPSGTLSARVEGAVMITGLPVAYDREKTLGDCNVEHILVKTSRMWADSHDLDLVYTMASGVSGLACTRAARARVRITFVPTEGVGTSIDRWCPAAPNVTAGVGRCTLPGSALNNSDPSGWIASLPSNAGPNATSVQLSISVDLFDSTQNYLGGVSPNAPASMSRTSIELMVDTWSLDTVPGLSAVGIYASAPVRELVNLLPLGTTASSTDVPFTVWAVDNVYGSNPVDVTNSANCRSTMPGALAVNGGSGGLLGCTQIKIQQSASSGAAAVGIKADYLGYDTSKTFRIWYPARATVRVDNNQLETIGDTDCFPVAYFRSTPYRVLVDLVAASSADADVGFVSEQTISTVDVTGNPLVEVVMRSDSETIAKVEPHRIRGMGVGIEGLKFAYQSPHVSVTMPTLIVGNSYAEVVSLTAEVVTGINVTVATQGDASSSRLLDVEIDPLHSLLESGDVGRTFVYAVFRDGSHEEISHVTGLTVNSRIPQALDVVHNPTTEQWWVNIANNSYQCGELLKISWAMCPRLFQQDVASALNDPDAITNAIYIQFSSSPSHTSSISLSPSPSPSTSPPPPGEDNLDIAAIVGGVMVGASALAAGGYYVHRQSAEGHRRDPLAVNIRGKKALKTLNAKKKGTGNSFERELSVIDENDADGLKEIDRIMSSGSLAADPRNQYFALLDSLADACDSFFPSTVGELTESVVAECSKCDLLVEVCAQGGVPTSDELLDALFAVLKKEDDTAFNKVMGDKSEGGSSSGDTESKDKRPGIIRTRSRVGSSGSVDDVDKESRKSSHKTQSSSIGYSTSTSLGSSRKIMRARSRLALGRLEEEDALL